MFSPNGVVPDTFWPNEEGDKFTLQGKPQPLEAFKDKTLVLHGVCDKVRGDGDNHMRGMGCLLTGIEVFPGNIQGGSDTPAGWASGISIDQEIKELSASKPRDAHALRFARIRRDGARAGRHLDAHGLRRPNKPIAPIDDPYQMFAKLYGRMKDQESLQERPRRTAGRPEEGQRRSAADDRQRCSKSMPRFVREMEQELTGRRAEREASRKRWHAVPDWSRA